ncbi:MAG: SRPBCC family protein [Gemmatimonadales bacterium]
MVTTAKTGVTTYDTPTDRDVVITRVVDAPRGLVFDAWTDARYVQQWMLGPEGWTMPVCEIDLRPGGTWRFVWRKTGGSEMAMTGSYREVSPPNRVVWTERWGPEWPETVNTLSLTEAGGRTTITLTVTYPSREARDAALKTGMKDGMEVSYARLEKLLSGLA